MKTILLSVVALLAVFGYADTTNATEKVKLTPEQRKAKIHAAVMRRDGGFINDRRKQTGRIAVVNAQKVISSGDFAKNVEELASSLKVAISIQNGTDINIASAKKALAETGANLAVFVIDDEVMPGLMVAVEDHFAFVNVRRYSGDKQSEYVAKEVARAIGLVCGAGLTVAPTTLLATIKQPRDLELIESKKLSYDVLPSAMMNLEQLGVRPYSTTTYREACRLGWAPAPTNEYQQAVWDQTHSIPKNPMKIKFDPEKGR